MAIPPDVAQPTWVEVEDQLLRTLAVWSLGSVLKGGALWWLGNRTNRPAVTAFGRQNAAWGAIDLGIATVGLVRRGRQPNDDQRRRRLRRTLLINAGLDVGYVGAGVLLVRHRATAAKLPGYSAAAAVGDGSAIVIQGGFLLILDLVHARQL